MINKIEIPCSQYILKKYVIQGVKVNAIFPKANPSGDVMDTVKKMLVHSYISTSIVSKNSTKVIIETPINPAKSSLFFDEM